MVTVGVRQWTEDNVWLHIYSKYPLHYTSHHSFFTFSFVLSSLMGHVNSPSSIYANSIYEHISSMIRELHAALQGIKELE